MTPGEVTAVRVALGLNKQELADLLGVAVSTAYKWEREDARGLAPSAWCASILRAAHTHMLTTMVLPLGRARLLDLGVELRRNLTERGPVHALFVLLHASVGALHE